jgi:iron complex transport system substrate-binding protein
VTPRIVSLLPSATEILCALGLESALVGRSHECDYPSTVRRLPVCTESKIGNGGATRAIHASISEILQNDISVYRVDAELLRQLSPTHIITQIQCEVCAVSLRDVEQAVADWNRAPRIVPLNPQSLEDVFHDVRRAAGALGCRGAGETLVGSMRSRMDAIAAVARRLRPKPRVAAIEWLDPLMAAGNWMPTLIELAGGISALGETGKHSAWIGWKDLIASDPDIIIVMPCGFHIADSERDWDLLAAHRAWGALRAVQSGRVFIADGNQFFNRPGPRLAESLEILAEILHPKCFRFGHENVGWQRCEG